MRWRWFYKKRPNFSGGCYSTNLEAQNFDIRSWYDALCVTMPHAPAQSLAPHGGLFCPYHLLETIEIGIDTILCQELLMGA
jgi:hypothetical protein